MRFVLAEKNQIAGGLTNCQKCRPDVLAIQYFSLEVYSHMLQLLGLFRRNASTIITITTNSSRIASIQEVQERIGKASSSCSSR